MSFHSDLPSTRVVYCRPLGGLNDTLCQVQKAWVYAKKTGRTLALDTRESGIMVRFSELFEFTDHSVDILLNPASTYIDEWSTHSIHPETLAGRLATFFDTRWPDRFNMIPEFNGAIRLPQNDVDATVIVHHQRGGGNQSQRLLRQIRVNDGISAWLREQVAELPERYVALHVRATDYTTDTGPFLKAVRRRLKGKAVVLCSDNPAVIDDAKGTFTDTQLIVLPGPSYVSPGSPLHEPHQYSSNEDKLSAAKHLLRDVAVMSSADTFYYTFVDQPGKFGEPRTSGLSRLVSFLVDNPDVRRTFLGFGASATTQKSVLVGPLWKKLAAKRKLTR